MTSSRFKMSLANPSLPKIRQVPLPAAINNGIRPTGTPAILGLNFPMLGRIANTRSGCGACGK